MAVEINVAVAALDLPETEADSFRVERLAV
jgi:hypothetical protein